MIIHIDKKKGIIKSGKKKNAKAEQVTWVNDIGQKLVIGVSYFNWMYEHDMERLKIESKNRNHTQLGYKDFVTSFQLYNLNNVLIRQHAVSNKSQNVKNKRSSEVIADNYEAITWIQNFMSTNPRTTHNISLVVNNHNMDSPDSKFFQEVKGYSWFYDSHSSSNFPSEKAYDKLIQNIILDKSYNKRTI